MQRLKPEQQVRELELDRIALNACPPRREIFNEWVRGEMLVDRALLTLEDGFELADGVLDRAGSVDHVRNRVARDPVRDIVSLASERL